MTTAIAPMKSKQVKEQHSGMGAIPHDAGVAFRVWAPQRRA